MKYNEVRNIKLTVVVPIYNVQSYLDITLKSLLMQSRNDFEVIIVDDGSEDESLSIAQKYIGNEDTINWRIKTKKNGGVSSARNEGISEAKGEYILFLDGDDYISHDLVECLYSYITNDTLDIICWGYDDVDIYGETVRSYEENYDFVESKMTGLKGLQRILIDKNMWIWTGSAAYRRDFLIEENLSYTEGCANAEDQEFLYKALSKARDLVFINKILSYYVQRDNSISNSYNIKRFDGVAAMKRASEYIGSNENNHLTEIAMVIGQECVINNYLGNYILCIEFLLSKGIPLHKAINKIKEDIGEYYSDLQNFIYKTMQIYKTKKLKENIKIKLYINSPFLYFYLVIHNRKKRIQ